MGLSLNPITNAFDEAIFNANWGLGESVVSGRASPDLFIVDKVERRVVSRQLGKKETSIWLESTGGTSERPDPRRAELTLGDEQLHALCDQIVRIEALYGGPMDIEWAFADGALYILQARVDAATYQRGGLPSPRVWLRVPSLVARAVRAFLRPAAYRTRVDARIAAHLASLPELAKAEAPVSELATELIRRTIRGAVLHLVPAIAVWVVTMRRLRRLFPHPSDEEARLLGALDQSLPGNVTVEMGLELSRVARSAPSIEGVETSAAWSALLDRYGAAGTIRLIDAAHPAPEPTLEDVPRPAKA